MRRLGPEIGTSVALFLTFALVYERSFDLSSANLLWHNFVFDADVDRIVGDLTQRQSEVVFGRHPLFALAFTAPVSLLSSLAFTRIAAARLLIAIVSATSVVVARAVF